MQTLSVRISFNVVAVRSVVKGLVGVGGGLRKEVEVKADSSIIVNCSSFVIYSHPLMSDFNFPLDLVVVFPIAA